MPTYTGATCDAGAPILSAKFWKKGTKIEGTVTRKFPTVNGDCCEVLLKKPVTVDGVSQKSVSLGNQKGLGMALAACGLESFEPGDKIILECVGQTATGKGNPRSDFKLALSRG